MKSTKITVSRLIVYTVGLPVAFVCCFCIWFYLDSLEGVKTSQQLIEINQQIKKINQIDQLTSDLIFSGLDNHYQSSQASAPLTI